MGLFARRRFRNLIGYPGSGNHWLREVHEFGDGLVERVDHAAGDFIFIAPGVPHEVFNLSDTEPVVAVVARSSADEWDKIVPYDRSASREAQGAK